jgi:hypothetical protein
MIFNLTAGASFRGDQLADEIEAATGIALDPVEDLSFYPKRNEVEIQAISDDPGGAVQAVVTAHTQDLQYFPADHEREQANTARTGVKQLAQGLHQLSPHDKAYAVLGRAFAFNDGADPQAILAIDSRAAATAYVTGKQEWADLGPAGKAWAVDELNAFALVLQALLVLGAD